MPPNAPYPKDAPPGLDSFMSAVRSRESGGGVPGQWDYKATGPQTDQWGQAQGAYQIMSEVWPDWASRYGYGGADPMDPRAQDAVAAARMTDYYQRYQSWPLVAVAWIGGKGAADQAAAQGIDSVSEIADQLGTNAAQYSREVMDIMGQVQEEGSENRLLTPGERADQQRPDRLLTPSERASQQQPDRLLTPGERAGQMRGIDPDVRPSDEAWRRDPDRAADTIVRGVLDSVSRTLARRAGAEDTGAGDGEGQVGDGEGSEQRFDVPPTDLDTTAAIADGLNEINDFDAQAVRTQTRQLPQAREGGTSPTIPVQGVTSADLSDTFGAARSGGRQHAGIDIMADRGTPVVASVSGRVVRAGDSGGLGGRRVWIEGEDGNAHYYAHLEDVNVEEGQTVSSGEPIGTVGDSGNAEGTPPHLHYSMNEAVGPEDPVANPFEVLT